MIQRPGGAHLHSSGSLHPSHLDTPACLATTNCITWVVRSQRTNRKTQSLNESLPSGTRHAGAFDLRANS